MFRVDEDSRQSGRSAVIAPAIVPSMASVLRSARRSPRKSCARGLLCFSWVLPNGRTDSAACPIHNVSLTGIAFEYDAPVKVGCLGTVSYKGVGGQNIMMGCTIRQCRDLGNGRYVVGAHFDRKLTSEDEKPDRSNSVRDVGFVTKPRKLGDSKR